MSSVKYQALQRDSLFPETQYSLLRRVQDGNGEAWYQFVDLYRPILYRVARRRGFQDADAQDLVQQVLLSIAGAIARWERGDDSVRFRNWLRRITSNAIINALTRGPKDRGSGGSTVRDLVEGCPDDNNSITSEVSAERRRELFLRAASVVRLDVAPDTWKAFELSVIEDVPVEEVATLLKKSLGAVYASRGRVMARLRRLVEDMGREVL